MSNSYIFQVKEIERNIFEGKIEDKKGRNIPFLIRVGERNLTNKALVVLHGHGSNKNYARYSSDEWLVICPLDRYGEGNHGCWWLGEENEPFVLSLLQKLILHLRNMYKIKQLFFWGSSMGAYGAILHGVLAKADAIYAHMPQVKLNGTDYPDGNNAKFYKPMLNSDFVKNNNYHDLNKFLLGCKNESLPLIFLSQNVFDYPKYIRQHFLPLVETLEEKRAAFQVEMNLIKGHKVYKNIAQVTDMFNQKMREIINWNNFYDIEAVAELENIKKELKLKLDQMNIIIKENAEGIDIVSSGIIGENLYACYIYKENELSEKKYYQENPSFSTALNLKKGMKIRYFLWNLKYDLRVSRTYEINSSFYENY